MINTSGTAGIYAPTVDRTTDSASDHSFKPDNYVNRNGFDLIWRQKFLQEQMGAVEADIRAIEQNANLSDTEKMFSMQMATNTWSLITNLRTNMLKTVSDALKTIVRNVS